MTKFLEEMTNFIFLEDEPKKADVIFVPGSEEGALAKTAARLYLEGYAPLLIPSGKYATTASRSSPRPRRDAAETAIGSPMPRL